MKIGKFLALLATIMPLIIELVNRLEALFDPPKPPPPANAT